jgi:hypothetical protein
VVEAVFNKGIGLIGMGGIAILFITVGTAMQFKREKYPSTVGQLKRGAVLLKSTMVGTAFGSEIFLIAALLEEQPKLGRIMLGFRLLHTVYSMMMGAALFGGKGVAESVGGFIRDAPKVSGYIDGVFARQNLPLISAVVLLSFADVELWPLLPWKASHFLDESQGFPSLSIMNTALTVNIIQSIATLSCQTMFLTGSSQEHISWQGKMIFLANIIFSVMGVLMGFMALFMKKKLLKEVEVARVENEEEEEGAYNNETRRGSLGGRRLSYRNPMHSNNNSSRVRKNVDDDESLGSGFLHSLRLQLAAMMQSIDDEEQTREAAAGTGAASASSSSSSSSSSSLSISVSAEDVVHKEESEEEGAIASSGLAASDYGHCEDNNEENCGDETDVVGSPMIMMANPLNGKSKSEAAGAADRRGSYGQELRDQRSVMNPIPEDLRRGSMRTTTGLTLPAAPTRVPATMRRTSVEFTQGRNPLAYKPGRRASSSRGAAGATAPPPPPPTSTSSSSSVEEMI